MTPNARYFLLMTLILAILSIASEKMFAQTVSGTHSIAFGSLYRSSTGSIVYSSSSAAQFVVTGQEKRKVRVTVSVVNLTHNSNSLPITLSNSNCAFSTDDGSNWTTFSTGTLYHDVLIPKDSDRGRLGDILVRVGGSVTSSSTQQRGNYSGTITVSASYQ